ncbi:hypothetical protein [Clostridium sp.]|jgi:hypothetical protein|uniref:hypothetical protein n=1 Tax=Clostridium sp. TaxID=1506 RepID=UPI003EE944ED
MNDTQINTLASALENDDTVEFKYKSSYYEIFESANGGFVVNVYSSNDKDEDDEYIEANLLDGGTCIGTARDAIGFML